MNTTATGGTWIGISLWHAHCLHSACWCITLVLNRVRGEKHSYIFLPSPRLRYKAEPFTWGKRWRMSPLNIAWQNLLSPMLIWPRSRSKQLNQIFGDFPSLEKETAPYHISFVSARVSVRAQEGARALVVTLWVAGAEFWLESEHWVRILTGIGHRWITHHSSSRYTSEGHQWHLQFFIAIKVYQICWE